jgi:hypothetical protein
MADMERPVDNLTGGPRHHFFGYHDKYPWDSTGRYVLALETGFMDRPPGREAGLRGQCSGRGGMRGTQEDTSR